MINLDHLKSGRREFLTKIVPAAASVLSLGCSHAFVRAASGAEPASPEEANKFLADMERKITYKQWIQQRHDKYIAILKHLEDAIGRERLLEMLKKASYEENVKLGRQLADRIPSLQAFAGPFRSETSSVGRTIVREIVEDSAAAFEMKITSCLEEMVFREANAAHLGFACVCYADFGLPVGINPKLKLVRTKTLMEGHDCCNHRYVWGP